MDAWEEEGPASPPLSPALQHSLEGGRRYPVRVEYLERDVNASVRLLWSRDGGPWDVVPATSLFTGEGENAAPGLEARYRSLQERLVYTRKGGDLFLILFEWPDGELAVPIPEPPPATSARLLGRPGTLPWRYRGDTLFVNFAGIPYREIPGDWAWALRLEGYLTGTEEEWP